MSPAPTCMILIPVPAASAGGNCGKSLNRTPSPQLLCYSRTPEHSSVHEEIDRGSFDTPSRMPCCACLPHPIHLAQQKKHNKLDLNMTVCGLLIHSAALRLLVHVRGALAYCRDPHLVRVSASSTPGCCCGHCMGCERAVVGVHTLAKHDSLDHHRLTVGAEGLDI